MSSVPAVHTAALCALALLGPALRPTAASDLLEIDGGILGSTTNVHVSGPPGSFHVTFFSTNEGPLPLGIFDPGDLRLLEVGFDLFSVGVVLSGPTPASYAIPVPNDPTLFHAILYAQSVTLPGAGGLFDQVSPPSAAFLARRNSSWDGPEELPLPGRGVHTMLPLPNGDYLVAGGTYSIDLQPIGFQDAYVFDHHRRRVRRSANDMSAGHVFHQSAVLNDGRIALFGGADQNKIVTRSVDLFDPATGNFALAGSLLDQRAIFAAAKLPDGRLFACGGSTDFDLTGQNDFLFILGRSQSSAEIWNPATGQSTRARAMPRRLMGHSATTLANGKVLIYGGVAYTTLFGIPLPSFPAEGYLYDPATDTYTTTPASSAGRAWQTALRLNDGRVLMVGGFNGSFIPLALNAIPDCEVYDPVQNRWSTFATLNHGRANASVLQLSDGSLVAVGGADGAALGPQPVLFVERWDPATSQWSLLTNLNTARAWQTAGLLPGGKHIAVVGGGDQAAYGIPRVEYYTP
jgi:N-acetylneuraminic acid mutarotase